jgi:hypothetical protein
MMPWQLMLGMQVALSMARTQPLTQHKRVRWFSKHHAMHAAAGVRHGTALFKHQSDEKQRAYKPHSMVVISQMNRLCTMPYMHLALCSRDESSVVLAAGMPTKWKAKHC